MRNIYALYGRLVPSTMTWSFCVKSEVKLAGLLLRVIPLVFGQLSSSMVKVTFGYAKNVRRIYKSSGPRGLAIFLKASYVLLQHAAGGMVDNSPWDLGANVARTRRGIPRLINPQHRRLIKQGDVRIIGFWLSLLGLYREVEFKGRLKLNTITDPGIDISGFREGWKVWVPDFYRRLRLTTKDDLKLNLTNDLDPRSIPFIRKASPNSGGWAAVMGLPWDIALFGACPEMRTLLLRWLTLVDGVELVWALRPIWKLLEARAFKAWTEFRRKDPMYTKEGKISPLWYAMQGPPSQAALWDTGAVEHGSALLAWYLTYYWGKPLSFGRLGFKEEPGKIRVFAMVSLITQTLVAPLHKWIFSKLRLVVTDGTFNQIAPINRLIERFKGDEKRFIASFDLSAATDRLPLLLQMDLLEPLLGKELTALWARLLVSRPYRLPKIANSYNLGFGAVLYAVGQPMGALSSWALLALTHHAIVQYAASNAIQGQLGWFLDYAVLGDDVVIANRAVAAEYLRIMKAIGVDISLAKSLVSVTSSLEFAKRTWIRGREVSPISLAELLVGLRNVGALEQLVLKCKRFGEIRLSAVARYAGFGYRNLARLPVGLGLGNRLSNLIAFLHRPGGIWPMPIEAWLCSIAPGGEANLGGEATWAVARRLWEQVSRAVLYRASKFTYLLGLLSTVLYTDLYITIKRRPTAEDPRPAKDTRKRFFSGSTEDFFSMSTEKSVWDGFFEEWVQYPFFNGMRNRYEKVDATLQTLHPMNPPTWDNLDTAWREVFETEDGLASFPSAFEIPRRETDEVLTSTRVVHLWRALRRLAIQEVVPSINLTRGSRVENIYRRGNV